MSATSAVCKKNASKRTKTQKVLQKCRTFALSMMRRNLRPGQATKIIQRAGNCFQGGAKNGVQSATKDII
jgi:hypothetical protein